MNNNATMNNKQEKPLHNTINLQSYIIENREEPIRISLSKIKLKGKQEMSLRESAAKNLFVKKKKFKNGLRAISSNSNFPFSTRETNPSEMIATISNHFVGPFRCKSEHDVDLGKSLNNVIKLRQVFNQRGKRGTSLGHRPLEEIKEMNLSARRSSLANIINVINPFANELPISLKSRPMSYLLPKRMNESANGPRNTLYKKQQIRCDYLKSKVKTEAIEPWDAN